MIMSVWVWVWGFLECEGAELLGVVVGPALGQVQGSVCVLEAVLAGDCRCGDLRAPLDQWAAVSAPVHVEVGFDALAKAAELGEAAAQAVGGGWFVLEALEDREALHAKEAEAGGGVVHIGVGVGVGVS